MQRQKDMQVNQQREIALPGAVYFDANVFIAMPKTLSVPALAEIVELARMMDTCLCMPQVAADEWIQHCCAEAVSKNKRLRTDATALGDYLDRHPLSVERISDDEMRRKVREQQLRRLQLHGIKLVPTPQVDLERLLDAFIQKQPPFTDGDKGFKDAIILETVLADACTTHSYEHVVLVSGDKVFQHDEIAQRFSSAGTQLHIVQRGAKELIHATAEKLKDMLDQARADLIHLHMDQATEFVREHEDRVFQFVRSNPSVGMSTIRGLGAYGERSEADKQLECSTITRIDAIRPESVESAFPLLGQEGNDERVSLNIVVGLEVDVTVETPNIFAEVRVPIDSASSLLAEHRRAPPAYYTQSLTIRRCIYVQASAILDGRDADEWRFGDLRLGKTTPGEHVAVASDGLD